MSTFEEFYPSAESYWRAIILFGNNVASYKFALGRSLLQIASEGKTFVTLDELAVPYSKLLVEHIRAVDKQGQRPTGPFLDACRQFTRGEISEENLYNVTARRGFDIVLGAFHNVNRREIPIKFFVDESDLKKGVTLTDDLLRLQESTQFENLPIEAEARWRLVETAWDLGIGRRLLQVKADPNDVLYVVDGAQRRRDITSSRDALNGYQKGKCFYCYRNILVSSGDTDVDHFFPWTLGRDSNITTNLDGVWNLVLACKNCNRGPNGKFAQVPKVSYLERLERRNNSLIRSHHPLKETLITQTGTTEADRAAFLRERDREAIERLIHRWSAASEEAPAF